MPGFIEEDGLTQIVVEEDPEGQVNLEEASSSITLENSDSYIIVEEQGAQQVAIVDTDGVQGVPGPPGPAGPAGTSADAQDRFYIHNQIDPATEWVINHPLAKYPSVTVVDSAGSTVIGDVIYPSSSQIIVGFSAAFGGKAYLN